MSVTSLENIFSQSVVVFFSIVSFAVEKLLNLRRCYYFFCFYFHYSWMLLLFLETIKKDIAVIYVRDCSSYVFSRSFIIFGLTFSYLTDFRLIFMNGVK